MTEVNIPDPWMKKPEINIDDGGGDGFAKGYDFKAVTVNPIKYAGYWDVIPPLNGSHFQIYRVDKPNLFQRLMNKWLIGWEWNDV